MVFVYHIFGWMISVDAEWVYSLQNEIQSHAPPMVAICCDVPPKVGELDWPIGPAKLKKISTKNTGKNHHSLITVPQSPWSPWYSNPPKKESSRPRSRRRPRCNEPPRASVRRGPTPTRDPRWRRLPSESPQDPRRNAALGEAMETSHPRRQCGEVSCKSKYSFIYIITILIHNIVKYRK